METKGFRGDSRGVWALGMLALLIAGAAAWYLYGLIEGTLSQHTEDLLQDGEARIQEAISGSLSRYESIGFSAGGFILTSEEVTPTEWAGYEKYVVRYLTWLSGYHELYYAPRTTDGKFIITLAAPHALDPALSGVDLATDPRFALAVNHSLNTGIFTLSDPVDASTGPPFVFALFPVISAASASEPAGLVIIRRESGTGQQQVADLFENDPFVIGARITATLFAPNETLVTQNQAFDVIQRQGVGLRREFPLRFAERDYRIELVAPHGLGVPPEDRLLQRVVAGIAFLGLLGILLALIVIAQSRRALEYQVREARKAKNAIAEFSSLASHQLKTPLTAIKWYSELLNESGAGKLSARQREMLSEIVDASRRMLKLINSLLSTTRVESGTFAAVPEPLAIDAVLHSFVSDNTPAAVSRGIALKEEYATGLPKINLDPQLMGAIIQNLLSNAIRYTKPSGSVTIRTSQAGNFLHIAVIDTGIGIPQSAMGPLWDKGFRTKEAEAMDTQGTGLGLYLIKQIVDATGGTITVESEVDKGSTFTVSYPLSGMRARAGTKAIEVPGAIEPLQNGQTVT